MFGKLQFLKEHHLYSDRNQRVSGILGVVLMIIYHIPFGYHMVMENRGNHHQKNRKFTILHVQMEHRPLRSQLPEGMSPKSNCPFLLSHQCFSWRWWSRRIGGEPHNIRTFQALGRETGMVFRVYYVYIYILYDYICIYVYEYMYI